MERIFTLDENTARIFAGLHASRSEEWFTPATVAQGVIKDGVPVALIAGTISDETIWLDWLYVKKEHRGIGIGTRLFNTFLTGVDGFAADSYLHTACEDDLKDYLERLGFEFPDKAAYATYTTGLVDVKELPFIDASANVRRVADLTRIDINRIQELLFTIPQISIGIELPLDPLGYMPESTIYFDGNEIKAMLFMSDTGKALDVSYAYAAPDGGDKLLCLLAGARESLLKRYAKDHPITATALNEQAEKLIKHLFPKATKTNIWKGSLVML